MSRELREKNRLSWNAATRAHNSHKKDQAGFLKRGGSTLWQEEIELLGDLAGKRLAHLQCNAGQDSLSLASLGERVTGVDISDDAIEFARRLSTESGIEATFERADIYDWLTEATEKGERFDVAFCSYGALPWIPDLETWAKRVFGILEPGGRLVLIEFHPVGMMFDEKWELRYPYATGSKPFEWKEGVGDYVAMSGEGLAPSGYEAGVEKYENPHPCYEFCWGTGQIIDTLIRAGFALERFIEYPYATGYRQGEKMRELSGKRFAPPEGLPDIPLMYGLSAARPIGKARAL
jgi:SAM-dependent methyltransferase